MRLGQKKTNSTKLSIFPSMTSNDNNRNLRKAVPITSAFLAIELDESSGSARAV